MFNIYNFTHALHFLIGNCKQEREKFETGVRGEGDPDTTNQTASRNGLGHGHPAPQVISSGGLKRREVYDNKVTLYRIFQHTVEFYGMASNMRQGRDKNPYNSDG